MIKAIETVYKGYRFRSRLEARWAVFFDEMGIEYQYEPEGFETKNGWYLPDFYLPEFNAWVEVKGDKSNFWEDVRKLTEVCYFKNSIGMMLGGDPVESLSNDHHHNFMLICGDVTESGGGESVSGFSFCHMNGKAMILPDGVGDGNRGRTHFTVELQSIAEKIIDMPDSRKMPLGITLSIAKRCATKARQARFEHGESPDGV